MADGAAGARVRRQREKVERALRSLPDPWVVLRDVRWPGRPFASIDHIAVGPSGVFVIAVEHWSGSVVLAGDVLRQNGRPRRRELVSTREMGAAVSRRLPFVPPAQVIPVLCIATGGASGWAGEVAVCHRGNLTDRLTSRPQVLTTEQVRLVADNLREHLQNHPLARPARQPARPAVRRRSVLSALSAPVAGLAVVGAVAVTPTVFTGVASGVTTIVSYTVDSGNKPTDQPKVRHPQRQKEMAERP